MEVSLELSAAAVKSSLTAFPFSISFNVCQATEKADLTVMIVYKFV